MSSPKPDVVRARALEDAGPSAELRTPKRRRAERADRRLGWVIVLVFCAAFTLHVARGLNAPFGYLPTGTSSDAYNGATWSTGARALRESGPIDSKFGGVWSDARGDYRYANHPPTIYPATAVAQLLIPDDELGARLLVLLASLTTAVLLFLLLCELNLPPVLAALSVAIGLSVPMFLTFGTMLDTLMLGLPFAAGYLWIWQRNMNGRTNRVALTAIAAAVCIVAWEGVILVAATLLATAVVRRGRGGVRTVAAAGSGAAAAVAVTVLWQVWVYGGLTQVLDSGSGWAGSGGFGGFSLGDYFHRQLTVLRDTFGTPATVVLGLGVVALFASRRFRPVGLAALGTSIAYAVGFRSGSYVHDYWNYWLLITLVLAVGAIGSILCQFRQRVLLVAGGLVATGLLVFGFTADLVEDHLRVDGERYVRTDPGYTEPARGQRWIPFVSALQPPGATAAWVLPQARFYFGVPLRFATAAEAASYLRHHPEAWIVLNSGATGGGEPVRGRDAVTRLG